MGEQVRSKKRAVIVVICVLTAAVLIAVGAVICYKKKQESLCKGKRILFMGDSITRLGDSERGWCGYFNEIAEPELTVNTAVNGATWRDKEGSVYDGDPLWNGPDDNANNVMGNQVEKVLRSFDAGAEEYSGFDVIFIACGTNDGEMIDISRVGDDYESGDRRTYAGAVRYAVEELDRIYPDAEIFLCSPIQCSWKDIELIRNMAEGLGKIAEMADVEFIDMTDCGIDRRKEIDGGNGECLIDGLHPNEEGARRMGKFIAEAFVEFCKEKKK